MAQIAYFLRSKLLGLRRFCPNSASVADEKLLSGRNVARRARGWLEPGRVLDSEPWMRPR